MNSVPILNHYLSCLLYLETRKYPTKYHFGFMFSHIFMRFQSQHPISPPTQQFYFLIYIWVKKPERLRPYRQLVLKFYNVISAKNIKEMQKNQA